MALIALAAVYFAVPADDLPVPAALEHDPGLHVTHAKHGIAALAMGLVCLVLAWRTSAA